MYNHDAINSLTEYIQARNGIANKSTLASLVQNEFGLVKDRSVFYGPDFAIRFCQSKKISSSFPNTVLSLSALQKYDDKPFIVCLVTPDKNYLMLANTSFLRKISHTSQELRVDNIKGSFLGPDIKRTYEGVVNTPANFEYLFTSHENFTFEENLERLVEATNNIQPTGKKFLPNQDELDCILGSIARSIEFMKSPCYGQLATDLEQRVRAVSDEIVIASFIENVNLRGRMIEHLITSARDLNASLIDAFREGRPLPQIYTADGLGDYEREFAFFSTATDIKTKILFLSSNPKGYNIDKLLSFLAKDKSVYLIYVVAIDGNKQISTRLCSMYNRQLLNNTRIMKQWAGRNSRGVTQYEGKALEAIVNNFDPSIDVVASRNFLIQCLNN